MVKRGSFKDMSFVGAEEEAHDHWRDSWSDARRTSFERAKAEQLAMSVVDASLAGNKASAPTTPSPSLPSSAAHQFNDPWRSVFHPGKNFALKRQGSNQFDTVKPGDTMTVWDHTVRSESSPLNRNYYAPPLN